MIVDVTPQRRAHDLQVGTEVDDVPVQQGGADRLEKDARLLDRLGPREVVVVRLVVPEDDEDAASELGHAIAHELGVLARRHGPDVARQNQDVPCDVRRRDPEARKELQMEVGHVLNDERDRRGRGHRFTFYVVRRVALYGCESQTVIDLGDHVVTSNGEVVAQNVPQGI